MALMLSQGLDYPVYEHQCFPGFYPANSSVYQYLHHPTSYWDIALDQTVELPTQYLAPWDDSDVFYRTALSPSTTLSISPTLSHATDVDFERLAVPFVGSSTVGPQLSPSVVCRAGVSPDASQSIGLPQMNNNTETSGQHNAREDGCLEDHRTHNPLTIRKLIPQDIYEPPRRQRDFGGPEIIEFFIDGKKGIRLSDALEGKWDGFEGRDDRCLFENSRAQIMLRLLFIGCPPWESKVPTADYGAGRRPITREKLAEQVAKSVRRFLEREKKGHGDHSRCMLQDALLSNIYLTQLFRVSTGSWQPEIFVA